MIANIYNKVYSYLPECNKDNLSRFVVGAVGVSATYWLTCSIPFALIAAGASYFIQSGESKPSVRASIRLEPPTQLDPSVRLQSPASLESTVRLQPPAMTKAAEIRNQANSCFCSSILWSFFANEPAVLEELPNAILRRLDAGKLFPRGNVPREVVAVLSKTTPINLDDFARLERALQTLESVGFRDDEEELKALLSLLELHSLLREFQHTDVMQGNRVNAMRQMVSRVNTNFEGTGTRIGDAQEVFQTLADLIFENSHYQQTFSEKNPLGHQDTSNWGHFQIPLKEGEPIATTLCNELEGSQLEKAPPFLALTLRRHDFTYEESPSGEWMPTPIMRFDPIIPNEQFGLPSRFFKNRKEATYELVGVSRRLSNMAHYDAIWKRGSQWYYGDDLKGVYSFNQRQVQDVAADAYLFFYRQVPSVTK